MNNREDSRKSSRRDPGHTGKGSFSKNPRGGQAKDNRSHTRKAAPIAKPKETGPNESRDTTVSKPTRPKETVLTVNEPTELLPFLLDNLPGGRNHVKAILARGQVFVGKRPTTKHNLQLGPGQKVTVSWTKTFEQEILRGVSILYEDNDLLVVEKEAGLLSIASEHEKTETAYAMLTAYVRRENPKSRIFVVHRLDRDTSGVMLYAKSEEVQEALQTAWNEAVEARTYVALVEGSVRKPEGTITSWLKESKTLKMYSSPYPNDGQKAVTHYKVLKQNREFSLLELELETGRKNQIRVHMEELGHPIAGDKKYGSRLNPIGRLGLHAQAIAFHHPVSGSLLRFESRIPKSFLRLLD
jgi:23S rRNA pseudouridine1911/1915/1917 synthase